MIFLLKEQAHLEDKLDHVQIQKDADTDRLLATMKLGGFIHFRHPKIKPCIEVCMKPF